MPRREKDLRELVVYGEVVMLSIFFGAVANVISAGGKLFDFIITAGLMFLQGSLGHISTFVY